MVDGSQKKNGSSIMRFAKVIVYSSYGTETTLVRS